MQFSNKFLASLNVYLCENQLLKTGDKVILAVSGGIDSMVLLDSLYKLQNNWNLTLAIAHLNHMLRDRESDEDEDFIKQISKKYNLDCYIERVNTALVAESKKLSIQETARNLRYEFLNKIRTSTGFNKIATGHNADDNTETILLNIFRGSGIQGLTGIPVFRYDIPTIRPLLFATRNDIEMYALENKIPYRVDSSNLTTDYIRNLIRHEILPIIKDKINPNIAITFNRSAKLFNELEEYLDNEIKKISNDVILIKRPDHLEINLNKLSIYPEFIQEYFLLKTARDFSKYDISYPTVRSIYKTTKSETGKSCSIKLNTVFYKDRNKGIFKTIAPPKPFRYNIIPDKEYEFEHFLFKSQHTDKAEFTDDPNTEYVDADLVSRNLILRNWKEGDWFIPLGLDGKKKVSDFFIDQKIPIFKKHLIPILESDGNIIWICGMKIDDRFKITENTKKILRISFKMKE